MFANTAAQPKKPKKFANINADQVNSNQQAVPVKYLAGHAYVAGDYISPAYNPIAKPVKTQSGKDETSTTGYKYFADFALMFCMGGRRPVDAVHKVIVDADIRWEGFIGRGVSDYEVITVENLGQIYLYWGTETQPIDNILLTARGTASGGTDPQDSTTWPENAPIGGAPVYLGKAAGDSNPYSGHYDRHPAYRGQCYAVFKQWKLGRDRTSVPNIQLELSRGLPWFGNPFAIWSDATGVNPVGVLYDWLTDTRFGMGLADANLPQAVWQAAYDAVENSTVAGRISPLIADQQDFRQVVAELLEYYDGWIRRNGTLIETGLWKKGTDIVSVATLTDDQLLGEPQLEPQGWGPTVNEVTVVYKDKDHHYNDYVQTHRDPNNFRIVGGPRAQTFSRPWIIDKDKAKTYAKLMGASLAMPFTSGTLDVKREWLTNNSILPGVVFTYDSGFYQLSFPLRLLEIEYPADDSAKAIMTVQWERSKWPAMYIPPGFQGPGGFRLGPRAIWVASITEAAYFLANPAFDTQIIPFAVRGNVEVQGYRIWLSFDGGTTYQVVPTAASTSQFGQLGIVQANITGGDTTIWGYLFGIDLDEIVSQTDAQKADDNLHLIIDQEIYSVGQVTPAGSGLYSFNVFPGRYGTPMQNHTAGAAMAFIFRDRLKLIDNAQFIPGTVVYFKFQPFTADLDYDLAAVTAQTYTIQGFGNLPTPTVFPPSGAFVTSVVLSIGTPPTGAIVRVTTDGTPVSGFSPEWPKSVGVYTTMTLTTSASLRVRFVLPNGRQSTELINSYTLVTGTAPTAQCGVPTWSFSGTLNHTSGNLTLTITTAGSAISYSKNGGATTAYSTPIAMALNDTVDFWGTKAGLLDSPHSRIDNFQEITYGGGGHIPGHPIL